MTVLPPVELAERPQWVAWRLVPRGDEKPTKVPYNARTGAKASTTDPSTWASFVEAAGFAEREQCGVGYVLSQDDPYVGVDLDKCRDPQSGQIKPWAKTIMKRLNSYTEISPSNMGLRIFVRGQLPPHGRRKGQIEIYSQARFLTITGEQVLGYPKTIEDRTSELLEWHHEVFGPPPAPLNGSSNGHTPRTPISISDADLISKARAAENGAKFWALWNGDYSAYGSQSEADLALLDMLAFWTGPDPARLDQLFRSSGLMREKWDRATYRDPTLSKALERTEFYEPGRTGPRLMPSLPMRIAAPSGDESPWRRAGELVKSSPERGKQLVEGLLWEGRTHWVYSGPGAGKTLLWLAILLHVADGREFHGHSVEQGAVLIIEEDSPDSVISDYLVMLADIYGFDLDTIPLWFNRVHGVRLIDQTGLEYIRNMIAQAPERPTVIALDACERIVPSDSFNSRELDPLSRLFSMNQEDGLTNVMIDHTRKPVGSSEKPDPIDTLYGGRTKSAISDVMMHFSGTIKTQAVITFPKFRGDAPAPINVSFDGSAGFTLKSGKPQLSESERSVMMLLNNSFDHRLTRNEIEAAVDLGARTVQRALNKLIEVGWADCQGENRTATYGSSGASHGTFS